MKRIIILCLSLVLLLACLPTPEQEYIVNKGDETVEEKINATPKPAKISEPNATEAPGFASATEPQRFPDRWDEDAAEVNAHVTISVHADVIQKADGLYPVYRTKSAPLTEADAQALAMQLLGKPAAAYATDMTKDDWKALLQSYLDTVAAYEAWVAAGPPSGEAFEEGDYDPADVEEQTEWYMEQMQNAPDAPEARPVSDYSDVHQKTETVYRLESGETAFVSLKNGGFSVFRDCTYYGDVYGESDYEIGKTEDDPAVALWHDVTMERADAEAILYTELARLGFTEYSVSVAEKACLLARSKSAPRQYKSSGWAFTLICNPAGYPTTDLPWEPSQYLNYGSDASFVTNKPVAAEHIVIYIDENGLQSFGFYNRKEITGLPNTNVELLPFEEMQRIAKNALGMCLVYDGIEDRKVEVEIYRAMLTTYTLRVKNASDYYEMPCWALFFDSLQDKPEDVRTRLRESKWDGHEALLINAIDGSIIHPDYGY